MCQLLVDSQAATFSHTSVEAAPAEAAVSSGSAMPAPPAVTVSEARLIRLGWYLRCRPFAAMTWLPHRQ
ncbi:hypothetical protein GA0115239_10537 [Streptomyces sp. BpilaLS-43]|nr:hypothetical protein GA0115239_10537 [Streptomyces sp. BpilaLS-43]